MRSGSKAIAIGLVAAGLLSVPLAALRQEVTLRYRWTKGDTSRHRITQQSNTVISGLPGGMPDMTIGQTTVQTVRTTVKDVAADGAATIEQVVESVKMEMSSPMAAWSLDTESKENPGDATAGAMKSMFSAMVGEPFTYVQTPAGAVKSIDGLARIAEKMFRNAPNDPMSTGIVEGIKSTMSDEGMRNVMNQTSPQFAGRPLKVGETWKNETSFANPMFGNLLTTVVSTLKSVEGSGDKQQATIVTRLTTRQDPATPAQPNPMGMTFKMGNSTGEGEAVFDVATGQVRRTIVKTSAPIDMSGSGPDGSAINMTSTVKVTLTSERIQ